MYSMFRWAVRTFVTATTLLAAQAVPAQAFAIANGEPADPTTTQFVARLAIDQGPLRGTTVCTGSLVSPRLVLTAAHCVASMRPSDWSATFAYGTDGKQKVGVTRVYKYSDTAGATEDGKGFAQSVDDLAVVELSESVTTRQPVGLDNGTGTVAGAGNAWVTELGYGVTRDDTRLAPIPGAPKVPHFSDTIKRAGQLFVGPDPEFSVAAGARQDPPGLLVTADPGYDKADSVTSGRCRMGDSGGPLVLDTPGGPVLLGVLSLIEGKEREGGKWVCQYTRVDNGDPYRDWLNSMISQHGGP